MQHMKKNAKNLRASQATNTHTLSNEKVLQTCIYMKDFAGYSHGHHHLLGQLNAHTPSVFKTQVVAQTPHPAAGSCLPKQLHIPILQILLSGFISH